MRALENKKRMSACQRKENGNSSNSKRHSNWKCNGKSESNKASVVYLCTSVVEWGNMRFQFQPKCSFFMHAFVCEMEVIVEKHAFLVKVTNFEL